MAVPFWVVTQAGRFVLVQVVKRQGKKRSKKWVRKQATRGKRALPSGPISWPKFRKKSRGSGRTQNKIKRREPNTRKSMRGPSASKRTVKGRPLSRRMTAKPRPPYCWRHKRYHWCEYTKN